MTESAFVIAAPRDWDPTTDEDWNRAVQVLDQEWIPSRVFMARGVWDRAVASGAVVPSEASGPRKGMWRTLPAFLHPWLVEGWISVEDRHRTETRPGPHGPQPATRHRALLVADPQPRVGAYRASQPSSPARARCCRASRAW